jgi:hypothetical protein
LEGFEMLKKSSDNNAMGRTRTFDWVVYSNMGKLRLKFVSVNVDLLKIGTEYNVKKILSPQRRMTKCHFEIVIRTGLSCRILKEDFNAW